MPRSIVAIWLAVIMVSGASALGSNITGNYKNILSASQTPLKEGYNLDLNRLRLNITSQFSENISLAVQYDIEAYLGSLLKTSTFTVFKNYRPPTKFDLISPLLDSDDLYFRHKLYRFYLNCNLPWGDLKIGRQKIPWGVAMVWNATDPFNPIDFTNIEREERTGVDALSLDLPLGALAGLNLVYSEGKTSQSYGGRLRSNIGGIDYSLLGAKLGDETLAGFDMAGQLAGAGIRGEIAYINAKAEEDYLCLVLSFDYTFQNSLYFLIESFYNGRGKTSISDYQWSRLYSGEIAKLAQRYGFFGVTYDINPLLKEGVYLIYNIDDQSNFINPFLDHAMTENASLSVGAFIMSGAAGSEYGAFNNTYYARLRLFF